MAWNAEDPAAVREESPELRIIRARLKCELTDPVPGSSDNIPIESE